MKLPKIVWRVDPAPTGPYRSFQTRGWPTAYYSKGGEICAAIYCKDEYIPRNVREGRHGKLKLRIAHHGTDPQWKWVGALNEYATLDEAKEALVRILEKYPNMIPAGLMKDEMPKGGTGNDA